MSLFQKISNAFTQTVKENYNFNAFFVFFKNRTIFKNIRKQEVVLLNSEFKLS